MVTEFLRAGAHYLTNAERGCEAGEHTAWIIVEADDDADARRMVPPFIRNSAQVIKPNKFTPERIQELHQSS